MTGLHEFDIALSKILLTAYANQLLCNLNLIKLCSTCPKQNVAVRTASDTCSVLTSYTLSDLVWQRPSYFIINFEQVIKSFLVWNIYFIFLY